MRAKRILVFVPLAVLTAFIAVGSAVTGVLHHSSPVPPATVPAPHVSLLPAYAPTTQPKNEPPVRLNSGPPAP